MKIITSRLSKKVTSLNRIQKTETQWYRDHPFQNHYNQGNEFLYVIGSHSKRTRVSETSQKQDFLLTALSTSEILRLVKLRFRKTKRFSTKFF
jgi:hypothetical protein